MLFKDDLYKIAKARLKKDDDVFDVIQETMITVFKSIRKLKDPSCFKAWLIKILISKSNNLYKKDSKKKIVALDDIQNYKKSDYLDIESIEATLDFNFICKHLKYEERIIIMLFYMERFTDKEIGKILSLNENTVKTKRTRTIQKLKKDTRRRRKKICMI